MKLSHRSTVFACYNGYITQAISINLIPLFYLTFQRNYALSLSEIGALIAVNFISQLTVDIIASRFADRMNLRFWIVTAHLLIVVGLTGLPVFPELLPPFAGFCLSEALLGTGGGFTEVMISPLLEACPTDEKSGNMSLLHSFYCWGQAGVALLSGLYFYAFDINTAWKFLPALWAIIPAAGAVAFCFVPIYRLPTSEEGGSPIRRLFGNRQFLCFVLMMLCAGASELTMGQWASNFAESTVGVSKETGDLLGPGMFALMMGLARALYGKFSNRLDLRKLMIWGCVLCAVSYMLAAFSPFPVFALIGCGLCGFSVGIFWPGTLSRAAEAIPDGGISMFAILALAGDMGCLVGPSVAGTIADAFGGDLHYAFCFALAFPIICFFVILFDKKA